jgi:hypothetical protein
VCASLALLACRSVVRLLRRRCSPLLTEVHRRGQFAVIRWYSRFARLGQCKRVSSHTQGEHQSASHHPHISSKRFTKLSPVSMRRGACSKHRSQQDDRSKIFFVQFRLTRSSKAHNFHIITIQHQHESFIVLRNMAVNRSFMRRPHPSHSDQRTHHISSSVE